MFGQVLSWISSSQQEQHGICTVTLTDSMSLADSDALNGIALVEVQSLSCLDVQKGRFRKKGQKWVALGKWYYHPTIVPEKAMVGRKPGRQFSNNPPTVS